MPAENVEVLAERVAAAFQTLGSTSGLPFRVSASEGTVLLDPGVPAGLEDLLREADERMYTTERSEVSVGAVERIGRVQ